MAKLPIAPTATDDNVHALLTRYHCQVPFHEVRTRFLGNIATPSMSASPMNAVKRLWNNELPGFGSVDAMNELIGALIMGLWNRLGQHQNRNAPFRLLRTEVPATRTGLSKLALMRRQEIDGFVEGLFDTQEVLELPERAHRALTALSEMRAICVAVVKLAEDETKPAAAHDIQTTLRNMREVTKTAEREIHAVVLACARARRQMLESLPANRPTLH